MTRRVIWGLCALLGSASGAHAQIFGTGVTPVMEIGTNLYQNTITAGQSVAQTLNMLKELLPVDSLIAADGIAEDMSALADVVAESRALSADLVSLNAQIHTLFDLETAPSTRAGLTARMAEIQCIVSDAKFYAVRVQALVATVLRTADHLRGLLLSLGSLAGNMQANQRLAELQGTSNKTLAVLAVQTAAFQRADMLERLSAEVIRESLNRMQEKRLDGWPRPD